MGYCYLNCFNKIGKNYHLTQAPRKKVNQIKIKNYDNLWAFSKENEGNNLLKV
jgi:hypothetical protein